MESNINIVIPWRPSGDWWRAEAYRYVSKHMAPYTPIYADDGSEPFSRSGSKNLGASVVSDSVVMFLDADTIIPHEQIDAAIALARQGYLVYPFTEYHSLSPKSTKSIFRGDVAFPTPLHSLWAIGWATGGAMAIPKDLFYEIGAYDEGFIDWGMEDAAILIMAKKAGIEVKKIEGNCYHLWHPREEENENIKNNILKYQREYLGE
jgi:predicted glycosyltransferase involved in capsule biosynthesis